LRGIAENENLLMLFQVEEANFIFFEAIIGIKDWNQSIA
jgi:hypothetical protein